MRNRHNAIVNVNEKVAKDTYYIELATEAAKQPVRPGQFVHLKVPNRKDLLLRRPISINTVDKEQGTISLIIQAKGEGTQVICDQREGAVIDILGPVGRGFLVPKEAKCAAIVGGGIGVAPLRYIMERWPEVSYDAYLGFRGADLAYQLEEFEALSESLYVASDDGTVGEQGFVTDILKRKLAETTYDVILACGPTPMLKALQGVLEDSDIPCQISLEERMGCGIGACKVCVCKVKTNGGEYKKVCNDGPVFDMREVIL